MSVHDDSSGVDDRSQPSRNAEITVDIRPYRGFSAKASGSETYVGQVVRLFLATIMLCTAAGVVVLDVTPAPLMWAVVIVLLLIGVYLVATLNRR